MNRYNVKGRVRDERGGRPTLLLPAVLPAERVGMVLPQPREIILMHGWRAIIASQGVHLSISKPAELIR